MTEAIIDLRHRDFPFNYNLIGALVCCEQTQEVLRPAELFVEEVYRFEGDSNLDDNMVLYALQARQNPTNKGLPVAAYGPYVETQRDQPGRLVIAERERR